MSGYTTGQRRYIESVDGRAHQQAVEIIGASERERDEAHAEIERLREVHLRGCECSVTEACQLLRERDAAVALLRDENEGAFKVWRRRCQEAERERDEAVALLRDVAQSGVSWTTRGYVVAQIDRATWDAVRRIGGAQ